jgi:hypothetical protein
MESDEGGKQAKPPAEPQTAHPPAPAGEREKDAIYQNNRLVARVSDTEVDLEAKEVRFGEIYQSDWLLLPDDCEFQQYRIFIQRVAYASKVDRSGLNKGRVLRGCIAEILGYREQ